MNKMPCSITDGPQYDDADMTLANYICEFTGRLVLGSSNHEPLASNTTEVNTPTNNIKD